MQAVAHVQGYLDGMGQPLKAVSAEMHELVAGSFLSPIWLTTAQHLAAGHAIGPGELADIPLRRDIHNAFATFGLQIRERGRQRRVAGRPGPAPRHPALTTRRPRRAGGVCAPNDAKCINIDPTYIPLGSNMQTRSAASPWSRSQSSWSSSGCSSAAY
jgi:hypothetical protein